MQIGGGLGEEYMHAPALPMGGSGEKGKGGFFANLLDLLGINHQVAKEPKDKSKKGEKSASPAPTVPGSNPADFMPGPPTAPASAPPPHGLSVLDDADAAFSAIRPHAGKFGASFLPSTLR